MGRKLLASPIRPFNSEHIGPLASFVVQLHRKPEPVTTHFADRRKPCANSKALIHEKPVSKFKQKQPAMPFLSLKETAKVARQWQPHARTAVLCSAMSDDWLDTAEAFRALCDLSFSS